MVTSRGLAEFRTKATEGLRDRASELGSLLLEAEEVSLGPRWRLSGAIARRACQELCPTDAAEAHLKRAYIQPSPGIARACFLVYYILQLNVVIGHN